MAEELVKPRGREQKCQPATLAMFEWVDRKDMVMYAGTFAFQAGFERPARSGIAPAQGPGQ